MVCNLCITIVCVDEAEEEALKCACPIPDWVTVGTWDRHDHDCHLCSFVQDVDKEIYDELGVPKDIEDLNWKRHELVIGNHVVERYESNNEDDVDVKKCGQNLQEIELCDLVFVKPLILLFLDCPQAKIKKSTLFSVEVAVFASGVSDIDIWMEA